jgi:hypothetical protein
MTTMTDLLSADEIEAMVATMVKRAKAGHMGHARVLLERDIPITASDREAIIAAVIKKAATGNRAAIRLKAAIRGRRGG